MILRPVKYKSYDIQNNYNQVLYNPYILTPENIVQIYDFYVVEEVNELRLYWDGDECLSVSGGWEIYDIGINVPDGSFVKASDHMEVNCPTIEVYSNLGIWTVSHVNMTGYTKLCFDVSFYRTNPVYGGSVGYNNELIQINSTISRTVIKQPIPTNINNVKIICHAGAGANKLNIYRVWLEN